MRLRYYGDPALRQKAESVTEITEEVRAIVEEMYALMLEHEGCGLAAPQAGVALRLFVSTIAGIDEEGSPVYREPYVFINPVLSHAGGGQSEMEEYCLSLPGLGVPVVRDLRVVIEALDIEGKPFKIECQGFMARHVMHECDHLDGILTIDRLKGRRRTALEPALRRMKRKYR